MSIDKEDRLLDIEEAIKDIDIVIEVCYNEDLSFENSLMMVQEALKQRKKELKR